MTPALIASLATGKAPGTVARVELLGHGPVPFTQAVDSLRVTLPAAKVGNHAHGLKINGLRLG